MEKYNLNIKKIIDDAKDIKGLSNVAWLFNLKKGDEIVLEIDSLKGDLLLLKVILVIFTQEILTNNPLLKTNENQNIKTGEMPIWDYKDLAKELTTTTGINFSVAIIP